MNEKSLSSLYRGLTARTSAPPIDADELVAAIDGELGAPRRAEIAAQLAASSAHASLARLLSAMAEDARQLEMRVAATHHPVVHNRHRPAHRHLAPQRKLHTPRWTALAACMVAALGVFAWNRVEAPAQPSGVAVQQAAPVNDVIFNSRDKIFGGGLDRSLTHQAKPVADQLFSSEFAGS